MYLNRHIVNNKKEHKETVIITEKLFSSEKMFGKSNEKKILP